MSTAAATASPAVVRSASRRQPSSSYSSPSSDRHQRTPSASTRSPITAGELQRPESQTYSHARTVSGSQTAALAGVARRDYETTNVARPSPSRRSNSRDRDYAPPPQHSGRTDSVRSTHRSNSRSGPSQPAPDAPVTPTAPVNGEPAGGRAHGDRASQGPPGPVRRRTTIGTQTGQWSLGKTIGAGSMGKVKLAKNLETGEQVTRTLCLCGIPQVS